MSRAVRFVEGVTGDVTEGYHWYERARTGLGLRFVAEFDGIIEHLTGFALSHAPDARGVRHVPMRNFPYAVFYRVKNDVVRILVVFHASRDPSELRKTIRRRGE